MYMMKEWIISGMQFQNYMMLSQQEQYLWGMLYRKHFKVFMILTVKITGISPDLLLLKFCGKAHFPHSFGRFARNYEEIVPFHKISTPDN